MDNKTLDFISKLIAVSTSILIFLGIISSVVYYRAFSINILDNITIGEALLLFISKFSSFAIATLFGILISFLFIQQHTKIISVSKVNSKVTQKLNLTSVQKLYTLFVVMPLFMLSFHGFSPFALWTLPVSLLIRAYVLYYIIKRIRLVFEYRNIDRNIIDYIQIISISIILITTIAMTEAYLVYTGQTNKTVTLYNKNSQIIKSDSSTLYLGKSQSFYYLYNKINKKAILIQADQIYRVDIK